MLRLIDTLLPLLARRSSRARGRLAYRMLAGLTSTERQIGIRSRGFRSRENP